MSKTDRRTEKTRQAAFQAIVALLQEKKYAQISVQEIIDRANIGRTTFYSHFPTKDDLLIAYMEDFFLSLNNPLAVPLIEGDHFSRIIPVAELFMHIEKNSRQIKGLMHSGLDDLLFQKFRDYWSARFQEHLKEQYQSADSLAIPMELLTAHAISSLIELAKWWLDSKMCYTPGQMELYYWKLILPGLSTSAHR